ncbi:Cir-N domain-containing protein [Mycena venus]|uniref:Cir-N domain-containing protein n=1 Tax=Mycena venus TaxID=2733690 RepID=A0A8H6XWG9_9AGAR|nr:Cir-N domain-containing protein [Mycena venus]
MGGGDLNMKKSWHPLLLKNQEQVWLKEKEALEEKKKLDQLRKEKEEERQLQELQRLQEEKTGKKRTEKLEWMYATPATGSSQNPNDLEDYLLGKKRVDKILTADENAKVGAAHKNFIAVQNANSARDIAAKIREDPLLAIKQQEQAALEALKANPLRLRELQERNGIKPKKDKKAKKLEKEERKRLKHERKHRKDERYSRSASPADGRYGRSRSVERYTRSRRSPSPGDRRSRSRSRTRSPLPSRSRYSDSTRRDRSYSPRRRDYPVKREPSYTPPRRHRDSHSPSRSPVRDRDSRVKVEERHVRVWPRSDDSDDAAPPRRRSSPDYREGVNGKRARSPSPARYRDDRNGGTYAKRPRMSPPPPPRRADPPQRSMADKAAEDRAARLAAMSSNATSMSIERQERLARMLENEKAELARDEEARRKNKGMGSFLSQEQKKVFGGIALDEQIRRGRGGMVVDAD